KGKMLEPRLLAHGLSLHFHQMHGRDLAAVVPGAAERKGWPRAFLHPEHALIEGGHRRQIRGADIHMIERRKSHAPSLPSVNWLSRIISSGRQRSPLPL